MFIPRGEIIHESLATSYVLVDGLVADLCEGGFSGVVEILLRDTDSFIVISGGDVAAVVEKPSQQAQNGAAITCTRTTVEQLADRSQRERGRVSIYGYSAAAASAVAGAIGAQPLYVGLSTEFTDLEKMILKLARERDREWFIEINVGDASGALIHMCDTHCGIVGSTGAMDLGPLQLPGNAALERLLDECNRFGGSFDVCFTRAPETVDVPAMPSPVESIPDAPPAQPGRVNEYPVESQLGSSRHTEAAPIASNELFVASSQDTQQATLTGIVSHGQESDRFTGPELVAPCAEPEEKIESSIDDAAANPRSAIVAEALTPGLAEEFIEPQSGNLSVVRDELPPVAADAEAMTETKRLMGEIARVIEEAAQAVGPPDSFPMSLRAGQLKIADRFPFLDPFAGEFEYLAGEVVFVGHATADEFVVGFTEALKLAMEAVTRSTAYPDRFRLYVAEDLHKLLAREKAEFERLGLAQVVREISTQARS